MVQTISLYAVLLNYVFLDWCLVDHCYYYKFFPFKYMKYFAREITLTAFKLQLSVILQFCFIVWIEYISLSTYFNKLILLTSFPVFVVTFYMSENQINKDKCY